ncbi:uncharacterized protein I206_102457 [Kwoniella pini CBS 10737]|uniref:histone acetyltransferase n=1 Tax=Kwoniella pini CBS 10737 TaxID=1296096 RepID=A0A1B9I5L4_9TREE|nr:uncharacterized protein I206_02807 [Kwoniella pini CBS 10737]OCF50751.1 hypothetical protein I206_02807 [Kwoniella pini CBS 10737]
MSVTVSGLRSHLLEALSTVPSPYELGLTVLLSEAKRTTSIFPHTPVPPKCYQQEILVVLSSNLPLPQSNKINTDTSDTVDPSASSSKTENNDNRKVLVTAISAYLYTFPSNSSSILYISKIDSSGYTPIPLPLTRILIVSFLTYFLDTLPNIRIQLFARAQKQYLFANSSKNLNKKVLSGSGLCKWWKGVYEETIITHMKSRSSSALYVGAQQSNKSQEKEDYKLNYLIPGYEELESLNLLGKGKELPNDLKWSYIPPFNTPIFASSSSKSNTNLPESLATLIPSLPDDPKTRFLEELVTDHFQKNSSSNGNSRRIKRTQPEISDSISLTLDKPDQNGSGTATVKKSKKERELEEELNGRKSSHIALSKLDKKEFWVRIGFRQECGQDVTGFFSLEKSSSPNNAQQNIGRLEENTIKTPLYDEKEDENSKAKIDQPVQRVDTVNSLAPESQNILALSSSSSTEMKLPIKSTKPTSIIQDQSSSIVTISKEPLLRPEILNRLLTALTNLDFADLPLSLEGTDIWLKQAKSIVVGEIGQDNWTKCVGIIKAKEGLLGMNDNGVTRKDRLDEKKEDEVVTMLMPKKKKKKIN